MTVGAKRNALCRAARGKVVAMIDDDNVYGPAFVATMLLHLVDSGAAVVSLAGFWGVATNRALKGRSDRWECYRNVGGRGETQLFWKPGEGSDLFDATVTWGEEQSLVRAARSQGGGIHRVWDDTGIFLHVDHGSNFTLVSSDSSRVCLLMRSLRVAIGPPRIAQHPAREPTFLPPAFFTDSGPEGARAK